MYVCMYVRMYVCVYVCAYVMYIRTLHTHIMNKINNLLLQKNVDSVYVPGFFELVLI
jgi:hypothetical protein